MAGRIAALRDLARRVAAEDPRVEQVVLFGSLAEGRAAFRSDADLLVIFKADSRGMLERIPEFLLKFADAPVPVDILVYTREELDAALAAGNRFLQRAAGGLRLV